MECVLWFHPIEENWLSLSEITFLCLGVRSFNGISELLSGFSHRIMSKVNTLPVGRLSSEGEESTSNQVRLERAKTEKPMAPNILAEEAAQIFDDKIPVQQKV